MAAVIQMPGLEFDEASHEYRFGGRVVPSVTQVLETVGISDFSMVPEPVLDAAQKRGTAVHKACWYDDQDDLDESSVDPSILGYLNGWRKFRAETGFTAEQIEQRIYCPTNVYAGTPDRVGEMNVLGRVLVDIKTGGESPSWPIQLAAYMKALVGHGSPFHRLVVQVTSGGTYKTHAYRVSDYPRHWNVFAGALTVYKFRMQKETAI